MSECVGWEVISNRNATTTNPARVDAEKRHVDMRTHASQHTHAHKTVLHRGTALVTRSLHTVYAHSRFSRDIASKREDATEPPRVCVPSSHFVDGDDDLNALANFFAADARRSSLEQIAHSTQIAFRFASHFRNNMYGGNKNVSHARTHIMPPVASNAISKRAH